MLRTAFLWASQNPWLAERLPRQKFAQRAVRRFMPGEELEHALGAARDFVRHGIGTLLTELGENVATEQDAADVARDFGEALERIAAEALDCELSVKPTHLGLDLGEDLAFRHIRDLAVASERNGRVLWIDMESSRYTDRTLELYRRVRAETAAVGVCVQANLQRTQQDVEQLLGLEPLIRLVKGAYLESADRAHTKKRDVDENYLRLARRLLDAASGGGIGRIAIATHDTAMIDAVRREARSRDVARACEYQLLYGIRAEAQRRLAAEGERVRVLISYGARWFPWYMRRLAERPANVWFLVRSLAAR